MRLLLCGCKYKQINFCPWKIRGIVGTCQHRCEQGTSIRCSPVSWDFPCRWFSLITDREKRLPGPRGTMLRVSESCVCVRLFVFRVTDPELGEFI